MQILPAGTFFIQRKPIAITTVTIPMILHFVPSVMDLCCTKLSRCFLYRFVDRNQVCNFSELFAKQNTVAIQNGTVGRTGKTMPMVPNARHKKPSSIQMILTGVFFIKVSFLSVRYSGTLLLEAGNPVWLLPGFRLLSLPEDAHRIVSVCFPP